MSPSPPAGPANLAVIAGSVSSSPSSRALRDGTVVVSFDVATVVDGRTCSVPVTWHDPRPSDLAPIERGVDVVVVGTVRRRFFRAGGTTQSRTEVVVERVVPARRAKSVRSLLATVAARLAA